MPLLLLAAVLLPGPLPAQLARDTTRDTLDAPAHVEVVVVRGARVPAVIGGAGAVVIRGDSLPIPAGPAASLERVLRQVPFVLVRQNSRGETELSVRGSDSRQAAVLLEGLPLTLGWDHRVDPSLVPMTGVDRLVFTRGLGTLLDGPNTLGGVLSLEAARGAVGEGESPLRGMLGLTVDHLAGRTLSGALRHTTSGARGAITVAAGGSARTRDGVALDAARGAGGSDDGASDVDPGQGDGERLRTNSDLRHTDAFASVRMEGAGGAGLALFAAGYDAERGTPPELHVAEPRLWRSPVVRRRLVVASANTGSGAWAAGVSGLALSVGGSEGRVEIERFTDRTYSVVDGREHGDEGVRSARLVATHAFRGPATLRAAATLADVRYRETLDAGTPDAETSRYRQRLGSVGAELEALLGRRVRASGGIVHDATSTPETGLRPALGALARWGWRGGLSFAAADAARVHASVSSRTRFASLRELYSGALDRFDPNPSLRPERLVAAEVGATVERAVAGGAATVQAVAFHHRLEDAIVRITLPDRRFRRVNRDEIRSAGLELLAAWSAGHPLAPEITADATVQRVRLRDVDGAGDERRPEHQPELRAALTAAVDLPLQLRGSIAGRYTGAQFCEHPDLGRQVRLEGTGSADAALSRRWSIARAASALFRTLRASLAFENLANATVFDQCGLPLPGRTVRVMVEVG